MHLNTTSRHFDCWYSWVKSELMIDNMSKTVYVTVYVQAHVTIATQLLQLHMHFVHED